MKQKFGFVTILGASNVGKSTLVNRLVGLKVSIVSPKVQTTRMLIKGIKIHNLSQIAFIDTPGIFSPKRRLDRAMVACAWNSTGNSDETILVVDPTIGLDKDTSNIIEVLRKQHANIILAINKIDRIKKHKLLEVAEKMNSMGIFYKVFMISALKGEGLGDLLDHLDSKLPVGPWMFPKDRISEIPQRILAEEITREKLFFLLHQEIPYQTTVETELWENKDEKTLWIEQNILVERTSQKAIILGKKGQKIKELGERSRRELETIFKKKVHLFIFVKVKKNWGENAEYYQKLGLDFKA